MKNKFPFGSGTPVLGFCAYSGTGKTTLLTRLIPALKDHHLRLAVIKHAHHAFDVDQPGKDSYELRKSGADQMLISSSKRWVLMTELNQRPERTLPELIAQLDHACLDLILVEGFKRIAFNKIELHRPSLGHTLMYPEDRHIIALAADEAPVVKPSIPLLDMNDIDAITTFVLNYTRQE